MIDRGRARQARPARFTPAPLLRTGKQTYGAAGNRAALIHSNRLLEREERNVALIGSAENSSTASVMLSSRVIEAFGAQKPRLVSPSWMMMNSDFVVAQSVRFARRLESEAGDQRDGQVRLAWRLAYGHPPLKTDLEAATAFLEQQTELFIAQAAAAEKKKGDAAAQKARRDQATGQALGVFCQALLASNRFLYID